VVKELSEFDFAAAPKLNRKRLLDLIGPVVLYREK